MGRAIQMEKDIDTLSNRVRKIEESIEVMQGVLTTVMNLVDKKDVKKSKKKESKETDGNSKK